MTGTSCSTAPSVASRMIVFLSTRRAGPSWHSWCTCRQRGMISRDDPVADHWPDRGQHGKEAIAVRHVLQQRVGASVAGSLLRTMLHMADWDQSVGDAEQTRSKKDEPRSQIPTVDGRILTPLRRRPSSPRAPESPLGDSSWASLEVTFGICARSKRDRTPEEDLELLSRRQRVGIQKTPTRLCDWGDNAAPLGGAFPGRTKWSLHGEGSSAAPSALASQALAGKVDSRRCWEPARRWPSPRLS